MQRLVLPIEDVDDRQPAVLVHLGELELLPVVPRVRGGPHFLDVLDRDCVVNNNNERWVVPAAGTHLSAVGRRAA